MNFKNITNNNNYYYNYNMLINRTGEKENEQLQHLSHASTFQTSYTNGHVCKKETDMPSTSCPRITQINRSLSCMSSPVSNLSSSLMVPDIRLEPPDENLVLENLWEYDLPVDMKIKLNDLLSRLHSVTTAEIYTAELVTLPPRYTRQLSDAQGRKASSDRELAALEDDQEARESDLSTALKWIRQEIAHMKEQDRSLLQQFMKLQDNIRQLTCLYDISGSCSDTSSLDGSSYSLNEQTKSPRLQRLLPDDRAGVTKPSVSLPNSPRVSRYRWGSQDML